MARPNREVREQRAFDSGCYATADELRRYLRWHPGYPTPIAFGSSPREVCEAWARDFELVSQADDQRRAEHRAEMIAWHREQLVALGG